MTRVAGQTHSDGWPAWALWVQTAVAGTVVFAFLLGTLLLPGSSAEATSPSDEPVGYDGIMSIFGFVILLVLAGLAAVAIVSLASVLGLPIRLMRRPRRWVTHHPLVPAAVTVVGAITWFVCAALGGAELGGGAFFNRLIGCTVGCLVLAFGIVHLWIPRRPKLDDSETQFLAKRDR